MILMNLEMLTIMKWKITSCQNFRKVTWIYLTTIRFLLDIQYGQPMYHRLWFHFKKKYDLSDKTVIPFCTHDGYGAGNSYNSIRVESSAKNMLEAWQLKQRILKIPPLL